MRHFGTLASVLVAASFLAACSSTPVAVETPPAPVTPPVAQAPTKPIEAAKNAGSIVYLQPLNIPEQGKIAMLVTPAGLRRACGDLAPMLGSRPMKKTVRLRGMSCTPKSRYTNPGDGEREMAGIMGAAAFLPHGTPSSWHVYFQTHDVDATIAKSLTLGAAIVNATDDSPSVRKVWYIFQAPGSTKPVS